MIKIESIRIEVESARNKVEMVKNHIDRGIQTMFQDFGG